MSYGSQEDESLVRHTLLLTSPCSDFWQACHRVQSHRYIAKSSAGQHRMSADAVMHCMLRSACVQMAAWL